MNKRLLAVFAHPDDEAFGPAGTLSKYAAEGTEIHLLTATRGEAGQISDQVMEEIKGFKEMKREVNLGEMREEELRNAAKIIGISKLEFLDFVDGTLSNNFYHKVAEKIIKRIKELKPQVILTNERRGISGHLDHIAISMITTYSYLHTNTANKLYYNCIAKEMRDKMMEDYFVYFPEGYSKEDITTRIDFSKYWDRRVEAMKAHRSQIKDADRILARWKHYPKIDNFILQFHRGVTVKFPETDLFAGIKF